MDVSSSSQRLRARAVWRLGTGSPSAFRIEDQDGKLLRTIMGARHGQEALALYWRGAGAQLPGAVTGRDMELRLRGAHALVKLPTPELPLDRETGEEIARPRPYARRTRAKPALDAEQSDLFTDTSPEPPPTPPEPPVLDADSVSLQRVDARTLRPSDRADGYLYHVTNAADAAVALRDGLGVSGSDPLILTERQGVAYWLSVLAEDYDYILDGPADFVVLRLRRQPVEELLETDAHASRSAGCPCFLLTGGAAARAG
ncbi:hypothetical protein [Lichenicoccus sp.]|uniref:hypothetical protein n=1 Tax=Lichenicoccus sp. TaxID=2781899 RepID=UPI003D0CD769